METRITTPLFKVKFRDVIITDNMEINNDLEVLMNESNMEIPRKHTNKNYTFDSAFFRLERANEQEFNDEYKDMELNRVLYYAKSYYNISDEEINRLETRYARRYPRMARMDIDRLRELFKNKIIKEMFKKYNPLIKEYYVEKFKKNIKSKLLTFMLNQVSPRDIIIFRRALERHNLYVEVVDFVDEEIELSVELKPIFIPRVILDIERRSNTTGFADFSVYDEALQLDEEFRDEPLDIELPPLDVSVIPDSVNRRVDDIVQTQEVTENGNDLNENEMDELERRFNALISDEPQAINPDEERMNDLNRRLEALRETLPQPQQDSDNVDDLDERYNILAQEMSTDTDLRNELEELMIENEMDELDRRFNALISEQPQAAINPDEDRMNNLESGLQDGGVNTQSKMTLFDDLDSDDFEDNIDSDEKFNITEKSKSGLFKLGMDEMSQLLNSIKLNNGCDDVIRFCQVSKNIANDCRKIPEIRNVYMSCISETMIMKVNSIDIDYDIFKSSMNLNRKDLLELEKVKNGTVSDYLNYNLDCSDLLKKHLLEIIDESIRQVYIHISEEFLEIMNINKISMSFYIYTIKNIKDIFKSDNISKFDTFSMSVKNKSKPILEYQLSKIENLKNHIDIYDIYNCFIKYLEILINYDNNDIL